MWRAVFWILGGVYEGDAYEGSVIHSAPRLFERALYMRVVSGSSSCIIHREVSTPTERIGRNSLHDLGFRNAEAREGDRVGSCSDPACECEKSRLGQA